MAKRTKHEVLKEVTADAIGIWAREIELFAQMGTTAFDGNLVQIRAEATKEDEIRDRMETIGLRLQHIGELAHNLVSASGALVRTGHNELRN